MIPKKLKKLLPFIQAYLNDERVQIKIINEWHDIKDMSSFCAFNNEFRIFEEPKLVPFTFEDNLLFKDKWLIFKNDRFMCKIIEFDKKEVYFKAHNYTYYDLLNMFTFEDGSPCGKYINE